MQTNDKSKSFLSFVPQESVPDLQLSASQSKPKLTMTEMLKQGASQQTNNIKAQQVMEFMVSKIQANPAIFVELILLPPQMWKFIGMDNATAQSEMSKIKTQKKEAAPQKFYQTEIDRVNKLKQWVNLSSSLAEFLKLGNLLKNSELLKEYGEMVKVTVCDSIIVGKNEQGLIYNLSLFHCQNLTKGLSVDEFIHYAEIRYKAIYIKLEKNEKTGNPGQGAQITDPAKLAAFEPRAWLTWINPRLVLKCKDARISDDNMMKAINWMFSVEKSMASIEGQKFPIKDKKDVTVPTLEKYKDNTVTPWWEKIMAGYKSLNGRIKVVKGVSDSGIKSAKWTTVVPNAIINLKLK